MTRLRNRVRAAVALLLLAAILAGAPVLLWSIPGALDLHLPAGGISAALTRPDDGSLLLLALVAVGWVCWAASTMAIAAEIVAILRGIPVPRLPGLAAPQRMAGALIGAIALLAPTTGTSSTLPSAHPAVSTMATVATCAHATAAVPGTTIDSTQPHNAKQATTAEVEHSYRVITVHLHDTLWGLAEQHLGAGERWPEIYRLNRGHPQPDGRALHDPDWIYPGWQLRLPQTGHQPNGSSTHRESGKGERLVVPKRVQPTDQTHDSDAVAQHYRVRAGDTLWDIADATLGDPTRWREIYQLNKNRPQPEGGKLTDAALILPGWELRLPTPTQRAPQPHHGSEQQRRVDPGKPTARPTKPSPRAAAPAPAVSRPPQHASPSADPDSPEALSPPLARDEPVPEADGPTARPDTPAPHSPGSAPTDAGVIAADDDPATSESALLPLLGLGLTAATLTGLVSEVRRRRRRQQSSRRPGQRIPMPEADAAVRETTARVHTIPGTVEVITTALRALASGCREAGRPLPDLLLIHAAPDGVRLQLADPDPDAVPPFTLIDDGNWLLTQDPATLPAADSDPYPALVALGVADGAMVLLNLEAVGTLTLNGDTDSVCAALRAFAADLAVGPFSGAATLTLAGPAFESLAATLDPGRSHAAEPHRAARELANHAAALTRLLDRVPLRAARAKRGIDDTTRPVLLISEAALTEPTPPWSGVVLIQPGADEASPWRMDLPTDGQAVLHPVGLNLDPQQLRDDDYQAIVDLLSTADIEPGHQPQIRETPDIIRVRVREALPDALSAPRPATREVALPEGPGTCEAPRVLLLGPVEVTGVREDRSLHRTRRLTELVAYLALHPGATASQIDEALWPGKRITAINRASFVSRTRQWLGYDSENDPYLPLIGDAGRLTLATTVTCDWYDFLRHARAGLHEGNPAELAAAFDLVRGRPFQGIEDHRYTWAETDIQEMISTIVDVAYAIATHYADHADHRLALQAALRGLQVDGSAERLITTAREAAQACGDDQEARRLEQQQESLDDDLLGEGVSST
jgi:nucleoid-associated protein YgaU/DNA-binding SARP family transcriptional activator